MAAIWGRHAGETLREGPLTGDLQRALHPALAMGVHRAVEGVAAGLQIDAHGGGTALRDLLPVLVHTASLDRDVVLNRRGVLHVDRDFAGLRLERGLVELELPRGIGGEL